MNATRLLACGLVAAGWPAIYRRLQHRHRWEQHNSEIYLSLYYEQMSAAASRAGLALGDLLPECRSHGATHIAVLENTLDDLVRQGALVPAPSTAPGQHLFASNQPGLIARLRSEFTARAPHSLAEAQPEVEYLALQGDLEALKTIGLGFDPDIFALVRTAGLRLVARPVSYAWPSPVNIERTLAQAAALGAATVAFAHDPLLGYERRLAAVAASLRRYSLFTAYFPDSQHQRGDWHLAKMAPERAILALRYSPGEIESADMASLAYRAALRVREGGIRLVFVDANLSVHASDPTAVLRYLDRLVRAIAAAGSFQLDRPHPVPAQSAESGDSQDGPASAGPLPLAGVQSAVTQALQAPLVDASPGAGAGQELLVPAFGLGLLVLERLTPLPTLATLALVSGGYALAANALTRLDRPRNAFERSYSSSRSSKVLALAALGAGPAVGPLGLVGAPAAGALAAAATGNPEYYLRIETLRTYQLDWVLPLAIQLAVAPPTFLQGRRRWLGALAVLGLPSLLTPFLPSDPLDFLDREQPVQHGLELDMADRAAGKIRLGLSPQPLRRWAGLSLLWLPYALLPKDTNTRALVGLLATTGSVATAGSLRQASRPIALNIAQVARSWALAAPFAAAAALAQLASRK